MPETSSDHHFTYRESNTLDLCQGDILAKTPDLTTVIEEVHPHYLNESYSHFIVLTQTCDLVRRSGEGSCKARYVSLAAVRPLDLVLQRELERYQDHFDKVAGVASDKSRNKLTMFLERVFNNNHPDFFYLHRELKVEFPNDSCAFLQLSIALRAYQHYETLLSARILSLADVFQAKLGWLVGNLYSRVGTEDWVPSTATYSEFREMINNRLNELCMWTPDERLRQAKKTAPGDLLEKDREAVIQHLERTKVAQKKEKILSLLERILSDKADQSYVVQVRRKLENDPEFISLWK